MTEPVVKDGAASKVVEAGIFTQVGQVFAGSITATQEPQIPFNPKKERVLGTLNDPVVRAFFSRAYDLLVQQDLAARTHLAAHLMHECKTKQDCLVHETRIEALSDAAGIFTTLFQTGAEYFVPAGAAMRAGWQIICYKAKGLVDRPFPEIEHPANTLFSDVRQAFAIRDEKELSFDGLEMPPIDEKAEESIVGKITSPTLKALYLICRKLKAALLDYYEVNQGIMLPGGQGSLEDVQEVANNMKYLERLYEQMNCLLWSGVAEEIPQTAKEGNFSIRNDWAVVRVPPAEDNPLNQKLAILGLAIRDLGELLEQM